MRIDWDKIVANTVIHCDTNEKAMSLLKLNELRGGEEFGGNSYWNNYYENTCYEVGKNKRWSYCDKRYFENNNYNIIKYDDLLIPDISETSKILNLEPYYIVNIEGYFANPCKVTNDYELINAQDDKVSGNWIVKMINNSNIYKKSKPKKMTVVEIEKELGYPIQIVE